MKFSYICYELYRISEIQLFFGALFESLFPERFLFFPGRKFGIQVSQLRWITCRGGPIFVWGGKVFFFNFWWVAKNYKSLFFWWAISPVTPNLRLALLTPFYLSPAQFFHLKNPMVTYCFTPELPWAPNFSPPKKNPRILRNLGVFYRGGL